MPARVNGTRKVLNSLEDDGNLSETMDGFDRTFAEFASILFSQEVQTDWDENEAFELHLSSLNDAEDEDPFDHCINAIKHGTLFPHLKAQ